MSCASAVLPPLKSVQVFTSSGAIIEMANESQASRTAQYGAWEQIRGGLYASTGIFCGIDPDRSLCASQRFEEACGCRQIGLGRWRPARLRPPSFRRPGGRFHQQLSVLDPSPRAVAVQSRSQLRRRRRPTCGRRLHHTLITRTRVTPISANRWALLGGAPLRTKGEYRRYGAVIRRSDTNVVHLGPPQDPVLASGQVCTTAAAFSLGLVTR
jgi:hypothetical protein